jgi:hypothetical protein
LPGGERRPERAARSRGSPTGKKQGTSFGVPCFVVYFFVSREEYLPLMGMVLSFLIFYFLLIF